MAIDKRKGAPELAEWIKHALSRKGLSLEHLAQATGDNPLIPISKRSLYNWAGGDNVPQPAKHPSLEKLLGWKPGSVHRILTGEAISDSDLYAVDENVVALKAADLTTDELLAELRRRLDHAEARAAVADTVVEAIGTLRNAKG